MTQETTTAGVLTRAIAAHGRWKQRLREFTREGGAPVDPSVAAQSTRCELGQWLEHYPATPGEFERLRRVASLHAAFHREAAHVAQLVCDGHAAKAEAHLALDSSFTKVSAELTRQLMEWHATLA